MYLLFHTICVIFWPVTEWCSQFHLHREHLNCLKLLQSVNIYGNDIQKKGAEKI